MKITCSIIKGNLLRLKSIEYLEYNIFRELNDHFYHFELFPESFCEVLCVAYIW